MATFDQSVFQEVYREDDNKKKTRLVGYELEVRRENQEDNWMESAVADYEGLADSGYDGDDIELVTHPFSANMICYKDKDTCPLASVAKCLKEHDCNPCRGGGTHINVSKLSSDYKYTYSNLLWIQCVFVNEMCKIFGRSTTWAKTPLMMMTENGSYRDKAKTRFANPLYAKHIVDIFFKKHADVAEAFSKKYNKALQITDKGNRYEFRGGKSTVDDFEALAWGQFCCNMVNIAAKGPEMRGVKFKDFLKGDILEDYVKQISENNSRKLSEEELNKTLRYKKKLTIMVKNRLY